MNRKQSRKLKMGLVTQTYLHQPANAPLWQGMPGFVKVVNDLDEIVAAIMTASEKQSARTGFMAGKKEARRVMLDLAWLVCGGLIALAEENADVALAEQVNFSRWSIGAGREQDVVNRCRVLTDLATTHAGPLAAQYSVTAETIQALGAAIEAFAVCQPQPRHGIAHRAAATKELAKLFARLDKTLKKRLDPLLVKFKTTNAGFYEAYRTSRVIGNYSAPREPEAAATPLSSPLPKAA